MVGIFPTHSGPGKPAGLPSLVLHYPGQPPATWVLESWEGGRRGGKEERQMVGRGSSRTGGSGKAERGFPPPVQPWESCWDSGCGPLPSRVSLAVWVLGA